ncbi:MULTISPECIES: hypothetical protein [unclassified Amycolatopsis]|uniref:hypothetical protein n=1 Tax=unclassified Amycolatopsis TaxID=2618356 RepID=UPI0028757C54|nr:MULTISPECIES: hypothetical protein [unclassified Amycolatopsis]MDS0140703.1 hypothetical protein [Amycolatopsis sp. 505]MDS0149655.1 hypothetical protein [Amycolatopsis sp. CM201R]
MTGLVSAGFRGLAALRRAPAFHPVGVVQRGELRASADDLPWPAGAAPVVARLSKGAGTPGRLPDALGLAVRIPGAGRDGGPWDILLTTAGRGHLGRMLPRPAATWTGGAYSSLVPYRRADRLVWLGAWASSPRAEASLDAARARGKWEFVLRTGREDGRWCDSAVLTLAGPGGAAPAFDPMLNRPAGLAFAPDWLGRLRERAYAGSRAGRPS